MRKLTVVLLAVFVFPVLADNQAWLKSYQSAAKKNYVQAIKDIQGEVNGPDRDFALIRTAYMQYLLGKHAKAISTYQKVIKGNPNAYTAYEGILNPVTAQKRWGEVAHQLRVMLALPCKVDIFERLMCSYQGQKKWNEMVKTAQKYASCYPSNPVPLRYMGFAYSQKKDKGKAIAAYKRVLNRVPGDKIATGYLNSQVASR